MSFREHKGYLAALGFIVPIYIVGWLGLSNPAGKYYPLVLSLTPLNLLLTTIVLLLFHRNWNLPFVLSAFAAIVAGFGVEALGVHTGVIFGSYRYGETLGWQLVEVPLVIGLNWLLLVYTVSAVLNTIQNVLIFCLSGALIMTGLDVLMEPVAMRLDFWQWESGQIPLQNYLAWFVISFLMMLFFRKVNPVLENRFAKVVLAIQFVFFTALNLTLG
jgi:uncharacterized membrane protein